MWSSAGRTSFGHFAEEKGLGLVAGDPRGVVLLMMVMTLTMMEGDSEETGTAISDLSDEEHERQKTYSSKVEETFFHLALPTLPPLILHLHGRSKLFHQTSQCLPSCIRHSESTHPNISMPLEIKYCETTDITQSINMNGELSEEIDDGSGAGRKRVEEDEGGEENRGKFLEEEDEFHGEKGGERGVDLLNRTSNERSAQLGGESRTERRAGRERETLTSALCNLPLHSSGQ